MNWLGFSIMAAALWGMWGFLSKVAALQLPTGAAYAISASGHLLVVGYLAASGGLAIPWHPHGLAAALGAGLCMALGLLFFFKALVGGEAAVVVPLTAVYPLVTVVLSWIFLHESFTPRHVAGVAVALVAVWLLSK